MKDLRGSITVDGDVSGHEFHGNQWSGGGGVKTEAIVDRMHACIYDEQGHVKLGAGFTIDAHTREDVTQGFSVGIFPSRSTVLDGDKVAPKVMEKEIAQWCDKNKTLLADSRNRIKIGGWVDPDTGKVWLDAVRVYGAGHGAMAYKMGVKANQKSIADLGAIHRQDWDHAFIDTHGTGTPVNLPWNKAHDEALSITKIVATVKKQSMKNNHPVMIYFNADATPREIHATIMSHLQHKEQ